jgi:hypothetical protein
MLRTMGRKLETELRGGLRHRHKVKAAGNSDSPSLRPPRQLSTLPQQEYARGDVHENRAECLFSLLKPYLWGFRGISKCNLPGYVGFLQFLRNFRQHNAFEQAELILQAALDPAVASRAKQGEFVTCFDHFDLLQTAMCAPLAERREELPGKPRGHMALARHCHAGARPAPQGPRGQPLPPPGAGFSRGCSGETRRASGRRTRTACLAGTSGQRKRRRG